MDEFGYQPKDNPEGVLDFNKIIGQLLRDINVYYSKGQMPEFIRAVTILSSNLVIDIEQNPDIKSKIELINKKYKESSRGKEGLTILKFKANSATLIHKVLM